MYSNHSSGTLQPTTGTVLCIYSCLSYIMYLDTIIKKDWLATAGFAMKKTKQRGLINWAPEIGWHFIELHWHLV